MRLLRLVTGLVIASFVIGHFLNHALGVVSIDAMDRLRVVLSIIPYKDEEDAVRIANDSPYGLAGAVWSKDEARAQRVARRIRAGQVDVNGGAFNMNAPFGGFKQSGHGREAGVYGLEEFLEYKSLQLKA